MARIYTVRFRIDDLRPVAMFLERILLRAIWHTLMTIEIAGTMSVLTFQF